mgnify:CR=1 FL=1
MRIHSLFLENEKEWPAWRLNRAGLTLIEMMMVVLVIGLLAAIAFPAFRKARIKTQVVQTANDMKVFGDAFDLYAMERAGYPPDCDLPDPWHLPNTAMEEYLDEKKWKALTPLGGNYNWEGPDFYDYAGIALDDQSAEADIVEKLDKTFDDGSLTEGKFRQMANGRYTWVLEE